MQQWSRPRGGRGGGENSRSWNACESVSGRCAWRFGHRGFLLRGSCLLVHAWSLSVRRRLQIFIWGGLNTYNGKDVIGLTNVFDITSAVVTLDFTTNTLGTLTVQVNTNFAGAPTSTNSHVMKALVGRTYGALFLGPGAPAVPGWQITQPRRGQATPTRPINTILANGPLA